jgi:putative nucleotidyltransferase with HDIG domain
VTALDIRENESAYHSRRVALCSLLLAILLEVDMDQLENIYFGALLHDVGKIGVRDEVLLKPARLTTDERRHIESHIEIGVRLLSDVKRFRSVLDIPQDHHERVDGTGYPAGKVRDEIPLSARMFAIVDVYDALRHKRPYKNALDHERARALLNEERGTHFHEDLLDCFCAIPESVWNQLAEAAPEVRSFTDALLACHRARPQHLTGTWPALCRA